MTTARYTYRQVSNALSEILAAHGKEHKVKECQYTLDGETPYCLVAHVVNKLDPEKFRSLAAHGEYNNTLFVSLMHDGVLPSNFVAPSVKEALQAAQSAQDEGEHWGEAARLFHETYKKEAYHNGR